MSRVTTSRAFLSAAAAAMMRASSVEVLRFALSIVAIGPVHPRGFDHRNDGFGEQAGHRFSPPQSAAHLGGADVRGIDPEHLGALWREAEFVQFSGRWRLHTGTVDDDEMLSAEEILSSLPGRDGSRRVSPDQDREIEVGMQIVQCIHGVDRVRDSSAPKGEVEYHKARLTLRGGHE